MGQYPIKIGSSNVNLDAAMGDLVTQLGVTDTEVQILSIRLVVGATGLISTYYVQGQESSHRFNTIP